MTTQPDLFGPRAGKPSVDARRSMPKAPMTVAGVEFGTGPECEPRPGVVIPEWLRLPSDDPDWMPVSRIG